ncbi:MAG TPA: hypothetical protein PLN21_02390 [Gemmatales bacterium]|nr:hypothetical protein [Gemmatales bacterium]
MKRKDHDEIAYEAWRLTQSHKIIIRNSLVALGVRIDIISRTVHRLHAKKILDYYLIEVLRILQNKGVRNPAHHERIIGVDSANLKKWWTRKDDDETSEPDSIPNLKTFLFTLAALNLPQSDETFPSGFEINLQAWKYCFTASDNIVHPDKPDVASIVDVICVLLAMKTQSIRSYFEEGNLEQLSVCAIEVHEVFSDLYEDAWLPEIKMPSLQQVRVSLSRWMMSGMAACISTKSDLFHYEPEIKHGY